MLFCIFKLIKIHLFFLVCRNLRELFKIDAADYMVSICGSDALRELSSPGKSGSVFFLSQDDRFMIKTLRKSEVQVLYLFNVFGSLLSSNGSHKISYPKIYYQHIVYLDFIFENISY